MGIKAFFKKAFGDMKASAKHVSLDCVYLYKMRSKK